MQVQDSSSGHGISAEACDNVKWRVEEVCWREAGRGFHLVVCICPYYDMAEAR